MLRGPRQRWDRLAKTMSRQPQIDYRSPAIYVRNESGTWISFGPMPLYKAVLRAVGKYRVNHEPCILAGDISLIGIDAILAVRRRADFPLLVADAVELTGTLESAKIIERRAIAPPK